jgi:hypothetical protein
MALTAIDILKLKNFLSQHKKTLSYDREFSNYMDTIKQRDAFVVNIDDQATLQELMKFLNELNKDKDSKERVIVRAAAGGRDIKNSASYSATHLVNADIVIRLTGKAFTRIEKPNDDVVRVGASVQIGELDETLYEKHQKVLPTASLVPYVTIAGLAATGGHGTGIHQPSFSGLVKGMTLCTESGDIVHLDDSHPDFNTIRAAHNGMYGIVLDMDIACAPAKKIQVKREKRSVSEFIEEIRNGLFKQDYYPYVSAMYVPTYRDDEGTTTKESHVEIRLYRPVPLDTPNTNHTPVLDDFTQSVQGAVGNIVNIPKVLRTFPHIIPYYMRYGVKPFAVGEKDELSVGPWHEQMHYRSDFPRNFTEICGLFPVADKPESGKHGEEIVKALEKTVELLEKYAQDGNYPLTYGLYFRFMQGDNGGLSITSHKEGYHICALDLATNEQIPGFEAFKKEMEEFFIQELNAKLHWGKNAPSNADYTSMYGEGLQESKEVVERWHQDNGIKNSMLMNPHMSFVHGYPVPTLEDNLVVKQGDMDQKQLYLTALAAEKLLNVIDDHTEGCQHVREEVQAVISQNKVSDGSIFKPAHPVDDVVQTCADFKKCCHIL